MPSRRELISMTPDEVDEFLAGRRTMTVATIAADGRPHLVAMWYGFLDGSPCFETYAKSQKVVNLRRDPRITCLVEAGEEYGELRGVQLIGTAELIEDDATKRRGARSVVDRYFGLEGADDESIEAAVATLVNKRVVVKIGVDHVVSWDHRKLDGGY